MTDLSPAAQAVLDAYEKSNDCYREEWGQLAAALQAVADQVLIRPGIPRDEYSLLMRMLDRQIRAIAAELEVQ